MENDYYGLLFISVNSYELLSILDLRRKLVVSAVFDEAQYAMEWEMWTHQANNGLVYRT